MENTTLSTNPAINIAENNEEINEEILKLATEKLDKEAESVSGQNVPAIGIYHFLRGKCTKSEMFAKQVLIETKTMSKCFSYIIEIYKERAKLQRVNEESIVGIGADSAEIFAFAEEYYNLDDEAIERRKAEEKAAAKARKKEEEEKRKAKQREDPSKKKKSKSNKAESKSTDKKTVPEQPMQMSFM